MDTTKKPIHGRGAGSNTPNRFEAQELVPDFSDLENLLLEEDLPLPKTKFYKDTSKTIIAKNDSPDVGFTYSINSYRGCEHGCIYCYARPTHEFLGQSAGIDFETKIFVKEKGPELLRERLMAPSWQPETIVMSGVTDCYQPAERVFKLTRGCLEVLAEFRNPAFIITKNYLVTRDIDILSEMAKYQGAGVLVSVTTLDNALCAIMEPRTSRPASRLKAIEELAKAGVRVGVNMAPVISGLTDHEMPAVLKAAAEAGATFAGYTPVRLPYAVLPLFTEWLGNHKPDKKDKILNRIKSIRGGKLNDAQFGSRMRGEGPYADNLNQMFHMSCQKFGLNKREDDWNLNTDAFRRPTDQLGFFD